MSDLVTSVAQKQFGGANQGFEKQLQQSPQNRSFESVMQSGGRQNAPEADSANAVNKVQNDPKLQQIQADLIERYQTMPQAVPKVTAIFPEYLDTKTRMSSFRNILNQAVGSVGSMPQGADVKSRFSQVEDEWLKLENVMRSDKELSQGELLGLQARLYQVSQHIDVLSKVVDQMTSGVKTILNTNV